MQFGAVLRACRERAGLTQEELAERLHRSRSCISKIETDKKTLDAATLVRWTDITSAKDILCTLLCGIDPTLIIANLPVITKLVGGMIRWM